MVHDGFEVGRCFECRWRCHDWLSNAWWYFFLRLLTLSSFVPFVCLECWFSSLVSPWCLSLRCLTIEFLCRLFRFLWLVETKKHHETYERNQHAKPKKQRRETNETHQLRKMKKPTNGTNMPYVQTDRTETSDERNSFTAPSRNLRTELLHCSWVFALVGKEQWLVKSTNRTNRNKRNLSACTFGLIQSAYSKYQKQPLTI